MDTIQTSRRTLTGPNPDVLAAQAQVCTGPTQSRPLGTKPSDPTPETVLDIIARSLTGTIPSSESASRAQIGAFFAAMTLRKQYPPSTNWSSAETAEMASHGRTWEADPSVRFILDPRAETRSTLSEADKKLASYLIDVLAGRHLDYSDTRAALSHVSSGTTDPALEAALLIGQRMNHEDDHEFRAYLDAVLPPDEVRTVETTTLTTIGEPYNGSTRFFKPTLFVAALRAAMGRPTLLHGVELAPPKNGVTEEQILRALGANTGLSVSRVATIIEQPDIGLAYLSQREFCPSVFALLELREHIKKRPSWAASEKAQQVLKSKNRNDMAIGYFHPGYEEKQLKGIRDRGLHAGCVIKGEEGTSQFSLRTGAPSEGGRKTLNYAEGFRNGQTFALDIDPSNYGFDYATSPRPEHISAEAFASAGYEALSGQPGHIRDRIILNTGILDWLLGYDSEPESAIRKAAATLDSGSPRTVLDRYIAASNG